MRQMVQMMIEGKLLEKEENLLQDKYDLMIDRFEEEMNIFPKSDLNNIVMKIESDFNYQIDRKFVYHLLKRILKFWIDMEDDYYDVISCWVLGTYFFDVWITFPYIFINAVKRSGKTRLLKLMSFLSKDGVYTMSLKEAVLFRLPSIKKCGLFIDETEAISSRQKGDLRELLNVAYKKGASVFRMRRNPQSEKFIPEEFELFIPVATANISGLDDVLADRCITIVLERSYDENITNLMEFFERDRKIRLFKYLMNDNYRSLVSLVHDDTSKQYIYWIDYINTKDTRYTTNTNDTNDTIRLITRRHITGRDLELWMPLFIIKSIFFEDIEDLVGIASKFSEERKTTDIMEDRDTSMLIFLIDFIQGKNPKEFIPYKELCDGYNQAEGIDEKSKHAMNGYILSRILKRLKVVVEKRRMSSSREVTLDFDKINKQAEKLGIKPKIPEESQETLGDQDAM